MPATARTTTPLTSAARRRLADLRPDDPFPTDDVALTIGDRTTTVPREVAQSLLDVVRRLGEGQGVIVQSVDELLTTGQAASLLGVSRTHVCSLVDDGVIPVEYRGTHRRLRTSDVLDHLRRQRAERKAALDEISRLSHEAGLYDDAF